MKAKDHLPNKPRVLAECPVCNKMILVDKLGLFEMHYIVTGRLVFGKPIIDQPVIQCAGVGMSAPILAQEKLL